MTATPFTPIASALGGALIVLAAVLLMALKGRIAGVSGIAMRLLPLDSFLMVADSDRALFGDSPQHLFDTSPAIAHL